VFLGAAKVKSEVYEDAVQSLCDDGGIFFFLVCYRGIDVAELMVAQY